jgi:hypothetical protein
MEPESESPFKKDEPVGTSWKWLLLALLCAAAWLTYNSWRRYHATDSFETFLWLVPLFLLDATIFGLLCRAVIKTGICRQQRNFEVMAAAVNAQRPFWMLLTVAAAGGTIYWAAMLLQAQPMNDYIKRWLEQNVQPTAPNSRS